MDPLFLNLKYPLSGKSAIVISVDGICAVQDWKPTAVATVGEGGCSLANGQIASETETGVCSELGGPARLISVVLSK